MFSIEGLVHIIIYLIVVGCILGLLLYLVAISPVPEPYKGWLRFVVLAFAILIIIFMLLSLIGGGSLPRVKLGSTQSLQLVSYTTDCAAMHCFNPEYAR